MIREGGLALTTGMLLLVGLAIAGTGCATGHEWGKEHARGSVEWEGRQRSYLLHVGKGRSAQGSLLPLIFALHGGGGTAAGMVHLTFGGFDRLADRHGGIVCYPQGIGKGWNDGRKVESSRAYREKVDDVGFLCALIDHLAKSHPVDRRRVYGCGMSNGGFMSQRLACEAADRFAAVGAVTAAMSTDLAKKHPKPARPISVMLINGTHDWLVPWNGGNLAGRWKRGIVRSTPWTVRYWVEANGCERRARRVSYPNVRWFDGTRAWRETRGGGREGTEVTLVCVERGGHTWPSGWQYLPRLFVGRTCRDVDGCDLLWKFFARHVRGE